MNRQETFELFHQGKEKWNEWAESMLAERKRLEEAGNWAVDRWGKGENDETRDWMKTASVEFSAEENPHTFEEDVNFSGWVFPGYAYFISAAFSGDAYFSSAAFSGDAYFMSAFSGRADFSSAAFSGDAYFSSAFSGRADFSSAAFNKDAIFSHTKFSGDADFSRAAFSGDADFSSAAFSGRADFSSAAFSGDADFSSVAFSGSAYFSRAAFSGDADFSSAAFSGSASFFSAAFSGDAYFISAAFSGSAYFSSVAFSGDADFSRAAFSGDACFSRAAFSGDADFGSAKFKGAALFNSASSDNDPTSFKRRATFNQATFEEYATFEGAKFEGLTSFTAIHVKRGFTLADAKFQKVPDFIQAHFNEAPRLDNVDVSPWGYVDRSTLLNRCLSHIKRLFGGDHDAPARWRALKRLAIQGHDHEREQSFFPMEIRSARCVTDWPIPIPGLRTPIMSFYRFWFGVFYGLSSNYGRSWLLPLIWWTVLLVASAAIFLGESRLRSGKEAGPWLARLEKIASYPLPWSAAASSSAPCAAIKDSATNLRPLEKEIAQGTDAIAEALHLAVANGSILGGIGGPESARRTYGCLFGLIKDEGANFSPVVPPAVSSWSLVQKALSLIFFFLTGLAIRNMLKMK